MNRCDQLLHCNRDHNRWPDCSRRALSGLALLCSRNATIFSVEGFPFFKIIEKRKPIWECRKTGPVLSHFQLFVCFNLVGSTEMLHKLKYVKILTLSRTSAPVFGRQTKATDQLRRQAVRIAKKSTGWFDWFDG